MNSQTFMKAKYFNAYWSNERNKIQNTRINTRIYIAISGDSPMFRCNCSISELFQLIIFVLFLYNLILSFHSQCFLGAMLFTGMSSYYVCILFYVSKFKEEIVIFLLELHGTIYPFHGSVTLHKHTQFVKVYT